MKVAQNDETNPDTQPVRPPHTPSISNTQLSPFGSSVRKRETPGILSRMFPPLPVSPSTALGHTQHRVLPRFVCDTLLALYLLFLSPSSFPVDPETAAGTPVIDYIDDEPFLPEQLGKPPLDHQISPILLYTACIRVVQHVTFRLLLFCCIACHCCYSH